MQFSHKYLCCLFILSILFTAGCSCQCNNENIYTAQVTTDNISTTQCPAETQENSEDEQLSWFERLMNYWIRSAFNNMPNPYGTTNNLDYDLNIP